jgi:hypothetical protein
MTYYILYPGDKESDTIYEDRKLGENNGFGVFWAAEGFRIMRSMIDDNASELETARIFTEHGKQIDIETFLTEIKSLKIREQ